MTICNVAVMNRHINALNMLLAFVAMSLSAHATTQVIESYGSTDLLLGDAGYYIGADTRPFTSNGVQVNPNSLAGWTLLGAEANAFDGYYVVWQSGTTFALWALDANGAYIGGLLQSAADLIPYETDFNQDLNGDGHIGEPPPTVIESAGSVSLEESTGGYSVNSGTAVPVTYLGTRVSSTTAPPWVMIGAETDGSTGYRVIWQYFNTFAMWVLDANGAFVSGVAINGSLIKKYEVEFGQDFDGDGNVGFDTATVVESDGGTSLLTSDDTIFIGDQTRPLVYLGSPVSTTALGAWQPLGVEEVTDGYEYFWYDGVTFALWILDADGNFVTGRVVSASDIRAFEQRFGQDLNGDGSIGFPPAQTLESYGNTSLLQGDSGFFVGSESRPLMFNGSQVATLGVWQPVGVEEFQEGGGFEMIWQYGASIAVWTLDANGNYVTGVLVSGRPIRDYETRFVQDIDGDGHVGPPQTSTVESAGGTSLIYSADGYAINSTSTPIMLNGVQFDEFTLPGWAPIGIESNGTGGYNLVLQQGASFVLWVLDGDGNYVNGVGLDLRAQRNYETQFSQDLNGDGYTGVPPAAVVEEFGLVRLLLGDTGYYLDSESLELQINGVQVTPQTIAGWTPIALERASSLTTIGGVSVTSGDYLLLMTNSAYYLVWYVNQQGNYYGGAVISQNEVLYYEQIFAQDVNGSGIIDAPGLELRRAYSGTYGGGAFSGAFIAVTHDNQVSVDAYSFDTTTGLHFIDHWGLSGGVTTNMWLSALYGVDAVFTDTAILPTLVYPVSQNSVLNDTSTVTASRELFGAYALYAGGYRTQGTYVQGTQTINYEHEVVVSYGGGVWLTVELYTVNGDTRTSIEDYVAWGTINPDGTFNLIRYGSPGGHSGGIIIVDGQLFAYINEWAELPPRNTSMPKTYNF